MSLHIDAYIGRGNARTITLLQGGAVVPDNLVTRVVIQLGGQCLDTDEATDPITLSVDGTQIELKLGLWEYAAPGDVTGQMTVYTTAGPTEGLAWPEGEHLSVTYHEWSGC